MGSASFRRDGIWYFKYKDPGGFYREKSTGKRPEAREYKDVFLEKLRQINCQQQAMKRSRPGARHVDGIPRSDSSEGLGGGRAEATCRHLNEVMRADRRLSNITASSPPISDEAPGNRRGEDG